MNKSSDNVFKSLAKGCIYGALCGDSIGSYLEFECRTITEDELNIAMKMPGGGPWELVSGQLTDDGELSICLGQGLVKGGKTMDMDKIAYEYKKWLMSDPFDKGDTINGAFEPMVKNNDDLKSLAEIARQAASEHNKKRATNGGLMRITPLCIWASKLNMGEVIKAAREDTRLSHSNQTAMDASAAYVYTIQHLLNNKGDSEGAYEKFKEIVKEIDNPELCDWLEELENDDLSDPIEDDRIGWVKHGLVFSLKYLRDGASYVEAIRDMLSRGGDTDTNCAIVGGMIGALHGFESIPKLYTDAIISTTPRAHKRSDWTDVSKVLNNMIDGLIENRPLKLDLLYAGPEDSPKTLTQLGMNSTKGQSKPR